MDKSEQEKSIIRIANELKSEFNYIPDIMMPIFEQFRINFMQNRGIIIAGDIGTGKTMLMKIFARIFKFRIIECRHVAREVKISGENILDKYGRLSFFDQNGNYDKKRPFHYCFDDLGISDSEHKLYGNECNIMAEVLHDRYNNWHDYGMRTYITTNKDSNEIENLYGHKCRERMSEMMSMIVLTGQSWRKPQSWSNQKNPTLKIKLL